MKRRIYLKEGKEADNAWQYTVVRKKKKKKRTQITGELQSVTKVFAALQIEEEKREDDMARKKKVSTRPL